VALSADAMTLVVGAPSDDLSNANTDRKGYVEVYCTDEDGWKRTQLGQTIYGNVGDRFGWSIDITAEGNNIILGSPGYYNYTDRQGYVQVYSLDNNDDVGGDTWKIGQDVIGEADSNCFGYSVSISEDGKTIAVIVINSAKYNSGYVSIYHLDDNGTSWEQIGKDIDGEAAADNFGLSVSLSANRSIIAIGAPYNNENIDASFQFQVVVYFKWWSIKLIP